MSEKRKNNNILLRICLAILIMIIAVAVCLMIISKKNNESSENILPVSSDTSSENSVIFNDDISYEINLKIGETCQAELTDSEIESKLIWISSDNDVATVDDFGNITAVSAGRCNITVIIMDTDQNIGIKVNVDD